MKQGVLKGIRPPLGEGLIEYRYEESNGEYELRTWEGFQTEHIFGAGLVKNQKKKLRNIIMLAKLGGHMRYTDESPPSGIVWFLTDKNFNLIKFYEL